jgi:hypothetical protein
MAEMNVLSPQVLKEAVSGPVVIGGGHAPAAPVTPRGSVPEPQSQQKKSKTEKGEGPEGAEQ